MAGKKADEAKLDGPEMETFVPLVTFDGYPRGRTKVVFKAGVESEPVPAKYAELIRQKGLAPSE